ncbi:5364_t:CDS:2 [Paraglomus occultum]|uniref:5364_t:CDS:1 n=1 Tax=Paraglomus occultum TaxID=144539 RepID=A0A9N9BIF2_9GLOM|nr:5364_t:CDS:2 [Paraglomus occultum]
MSAQSNNQAIADITSDETKYCKCCKTSRRIDDFVRTWVSSSIERNTDTLDSSEIGQGDTEIGSEINDESNYDDLIYNIEDIENAIKDEFTNNDDQPIKFSLEVELDDIMTIVNDTSVNQDLNLVAHETAKHLQVHIENGSEYYWEIRRTHVNKKDGEFTGVVTVYFGCTQREDRQFSRSSEESSKYEREVRPAIQHYPCKGSITMKIDLSSKRAKILFNHQSSHPKPTHRGINISLNAINWIKNNINYGGIRKVEFYKRLSNEGLIDPKTHTYQQVYYWVAKLSKNQFVTDTKNQLKSSKNFLDHNTQADEGYKVIFYLENDFVRALGFITPFLRFIERSSIIELVVDSTFKTNQERFELFAVIVNNGGYGVPLAYLYLDTFVPLENVSDNHSDNRIRNREGVLREFFSALHCEGVLPTFVLVDKDIGQINAIEAAWDGRTIVQICLWHVVHAIERKIRESKEKNSQYTINMAQAANSQFDFIDPQWRPTSNNTATICPDEYRKDVLRIIKKHALAHPLIPISRDTFLTKEQIYYQSVREAYQFCQSNDLIHLWGYLWCNWYQRKHWDHFARASYPQALPLARTTMIVESHWRVLKYNYKYRYNRPRLDQLTQIITKQLVADHIDLWRRYCNNREFPSWWHAFKREWNDAKEKDMDDAHQYHTDTVSWICSCPAYLKHPYLICKHLVATKIRLVPGFMPLFKDIMRRHDYPFIDFHQESNARILLDNIPWNNVQENEHQSINEPLEKHSNHWSFMGST